MDDDFINSETSHGHLNPGEQFHGYLIERRIGRGANGDVYLAKHEMLGIMYAIKVMEMSDSPPGGETARRFVREAKIAARIQHPNLVRVHDAGCDEPMNVYYLVMDYMSGGTLRDRIALGGPLPAPEAVAIVRAVASALDAGAQMGLVHRDLKPENIMFSESGIAKLVDLGIAKVCDEETLHTRTSATFGTPAYVAPEQALDASKVDSRADIYSLGVILFEMLCGRRPYGGSTPMAIISQVISDEPLPDVKRYNPDVPNWASALVFRMCAKDVEKRISSPAKLLSVIDGYLGRRSDFVDYAVTAKKDPYSYLQDAFAGGERDGGADSGGGKKAKAGCRFAAIALAAAVLFLLIIAMVLV